MPLAAPRPQCLLASMRAMRLDAAPASQRAYGAAYQQRRRQRQHDRSNHRPFSTTRAHAIGKSALRPPTVKPPAQKSIKVLMAEGQASMQVPDDNGLFPGTFVTAVRAHQPAITSNPRGWWKYQVQWLKAKAIDVGGKLVFKYWLVSLKSKSEIRALSWPAWIRHKLLGPRPSLDRFTVAKTAQDLYEQMYHALASGKIDELRPRLCESIHASLSARVANRPPGQRTLWTLHRYVGAPRVVSYRASLFDPGEESHRRTTSQQVVVRIRSMQSLRKMKKVREGKVVREVLDVGSVAGDEGKEVLEYFVVQRMMRKGVPGPWMIWGTTTETTLASLERAEQLARA